MFGITPYNKYHGVYAPFRELEKMEKELFSGRDGLASFRTDIKDNGDAYLLEAELPGFKKEDIHVDIANGVLTVTRIFFSTRMIRLLMFTKSTHNPL